MAEQAQTVEIGYFVNQALTEVDNFMALLAPVRVCRSQFPVQRSRFGDCKPAKSCVWSQNFGTCTKVQRFSHRMQRYAGRRSPNQKVHPRARRRARARSTRTIYKGSEVILGKILAGKQNWSIAGQRKGLEGERTFSN